MTENTKEQKGKFIVFEGPDGSGKTTQIKLIYEYLRHELTEDIIMTKEPGGTEISNKIRQILLDPDNVLLEDLTEVFLYAASRAQHVKELIKPHLDQGFYVLCDRFVDSTIAYQGYGRGLDVSLIKKLNTVAAQGLQPNLSFYIMVKPEIAMQRIAQSRSFDRLEQNEISFYQNLYRGYLALLEEDDSKHYINGEQTVTEVNEDIKKVLQKKL